MHLKAFDKEGGEVLTVDYLPVVNVPDVCVWLEKKGLFAVLSSEGLPNHGKGVEKRFCERFPHYTEHFNGR